MHDSCDSVSTNTQTTRYESDANTRTAVGLATSLKDSAARRRDVDLALFVRMAHGRPMRDIRCTKHEAHGRAP